MRLLERRNERLQQMPPGSGTQRESVRDPWSQASAAMFGLGQTAVIKFGTITDATAIANCYRVQLEKGTATMLGLFAQSAASEVIGAKPLGTIPPGTPVICAEHPHSQYVIILGVLPRPMTDPRLGMSDFISQATRWRVDEAHRMPIIMPGGAIDWSAGRPLDSTSVGEQGWQTELGGRIFIDPFMIQMMIDEVCGVSMFYADQLLRLSGYNLDLETAGSIREAHDDEGEYNDFTGTTPYPYEQAGRFARGDNFKDLSAQEWQIDKPWYSAVEPQDDRYVPWHRLREYRGYLGQGYLRQLAAPPDAATNRLGASAGQSPILFQEWLGLDGRLVVASARGFSFVKRVALAGPERKLLVNDPEGDNAENYRAAGLSGGGPAHRIKSTLQTRTAQPGQERVAGVRDLHAYVFNYASIHPFLAHAKDFETPDTDALPHAQSWTPDYSALAGRYSLPEPDKQQIHVDHRYGSVDYFSGQASWDITEDGSIVFLSAYGSGIVLGPNGVELHSPGDITLRSGKSVVNWAGQDIISRAQGSIDLTTTNNDIRLKADKDLQIIAGNRGRGGVLIESRSSGDTYEFDEPGEKSVSSGIVLRAPNSKLLTLSAGAYVRTGGPNISAGDIVLDAGRGASKIISHSQSIEHHIKTRLIIWQGTGTTERVEVKKAIAEFQPSRAVLGGELWVNGGGVFSKSVLVRGSILVADGHIATQQAEQNPLVSPLTGGGLAQVDSAVTRATTEATKDLVKDGQKQYDESLKRNFYEDGKPGSNILLQKLQASLRGDEDYHRGGVPEDYAVRAAPWQSTTLGSPWTESPVRFNDTLTYPHPGKAALVERKVFYPGTPSDLRQEDGSDASHGTAAELPDAFVNPQYSDVEPQILDGAYKTIADYSAITTS